MLVKSREKPRHGKEQNPPWGYTIGAGFKLTINCRKIQVEARTNREKIKEPDRRTAGGIYTFSPVSFITKTLSKVQFNSLAICSSSVTEKSFLFNLVVRYCREIPKADARAVIVNPRRRINNRNFSDMVMRKPLSLICSYRLL